MSRRLPAEPATDRRGTPSRSPAGSALPAGSVGLFCVGGEMVSELIIESLKEYVRSGLPRGGFLSAVLENNLIDAAERADDTNRPALGEIAIWVRDNVPSAARGSRAKVQAWTAQGGQRDLEVSPAGG